MLKTNQQTYEQAKQASTNDFQHQSRPNYTKIATVTSGLDPKIASLWEDYKDPRDSE